MGALLAAPVFGLFAARASHAWPEWSRALQGPGPNASQTAFAVGVMLLAALCAIQWRPDAVLFATGIAALLLFGALVDMRTLTLPDVSTLGTAAVALFAAAAEGQDAATESLAGFAVGFGALWLLAVAYRRHRGHEGLGFGDVKLAGAAGALCGPERLAWVILAAATLGLLLTPFRRSHYRQEPAPFGPALAAATFVVLLSRTPP